MQKVLLVASKTGYQVREFASAAERLGVELVLATDRCHILDDPWGDRAVAVDFDEPEASLEALAARGPFSGILAVGDQPATAAARVAPGLNLRFHPAGAAQAAGNKLSTRTRFRDAGLLVPPYGIYPSVTRYPCVLKPLHLSASRGVIRADTPAECVAAFERVQTIAGDGSVLVEEFIPGREFALDGVVTGGQLHGLALFDKPDPLDGPFFEETIYVTPSREPESIQRQIRETAGRAVVALGFTDGPVHAEMRVNERGVWMLEVAARPIGGLCSRVLRFESMTFEELLLRHSLGEDVSGVRLAPGAHGVMMIPIPGAGVYRGVEGLDRARAVAGIEGLEITAKVGQELLPLPEGSSYLGFLFSRGPSADNVESALRQAHGCLRFEIASALSVLK